MKQVIKVYLMEYKKARHRFLSLILLGALAFQLAFMLWNMKDSSQGWMAQLYNMALLNSMLMPTILSVFASRLMDMEHKAHSWKFLKTMQSPNGLFMSKLLYGFFSLFLFCLAQLGGLYLLGRYYGFPTPCPFPQYGLYGLSTLFICFILFCLQLLLSFIWANQAVGLSIGLMGSLIGLFIQFLPRGILYQVIPWGLFGATGIVAMDWNPQMRTTDFYFTSPLTGSFAAIFLWLLMLLILGLKLFTEYDVERLHFALLPSSLQKEKKNSRKAASKSAQSKKGLSRLPMEWIKLKRSPLWIAFILLPGISAFFGTFNYLMNLGVLQKEWYSLWTQHSLFFCMLFMPALLGIYSSCLWQLEHKGTNWNQLLTLTSPIKIVTRKLLAALFLLGLTLLWQSFLFIVCGKLAGISSPLPQEMVSWFLCGFAGGIAVCSAQIFLSLVIRSFALPIAISTAGGIAGLVFTAKGLWYLFPYSLFSVGMRANNPNMELNLPQFIPACLVFILIPYLLSIFYLVRADVRT